MNIVDYQKWTIETAAYPGAGDKSGFELTYLTTGFVGEAGEFANKFKKLLRNGDITPNHDATNPAVWRATLLDELGDCLWYAARICEVLGTDLTEVATHNKAKLETRKQKGEIKNHS